MSKKKKIRTLDTPCINRRMKSGTGPHLAHDGSKIFKNPNKPVPIPINNLALTFIESKPTGNCIIAYVAKNADRTYP